MNLTHHIQLRYVQRVQGIKNDRAANAYLAKHNYEVFYKTCEMINKATLIYERFSPAGTGATYNYFMSEEDILFVQSSNTGEWITLYHVRLEDEEDTNTELISKYLKQLRQNNDTLQKLNKLKQGLDEQAKKYEYQAADIEKHFGPDYSEDKRFEAYVHEVQANAKVAIEKALSVTMEIRETKRNSRQVLDKLLFGFKYQFEQQAT